MAPLFFSSLNQDIFFLGRLFHSIFCRRYKAADRSRLDFLREEVQELESLKRVAAPSRRRMENPGEKEEKVSSVEISHPWPEWVELMDHLLKKGYLDRGIFLSSSSASSSSKESKQIRTACLNFARENSRLIRYLSRKDIRIIVGSGCPSLDRKVVNSGKRLRAYVGTNEGEVCSSCLLRGNCDRAYVKANEDEKGRTLDVMRVLSAYEYNAMTRSVEGLCLNQSVEESIRKLLHDIVDTSIEGYGSISEDSHVMEKSQIKIPMKQGDWICPKCNFLNFAKNIKCLRCTGVFQERLAKLREDREHLPLKKGDWICEKCNFFNFAKNVKCVQCNEKPTNRMLNPGEWECASCYYINFRKNYYCLKCGWKRPKAECVVHNATESHVNSRNQHNKPSESTFSHFLRVKSMGLSNSPKYSFCEDAGQDAVGKNKFKSFAEFHEFPIVGGKSAISKDELARERWKGGMSSMKKGIVALESSTKNGDDALSSSSFKNISTDECSSDEDDMAGWFGE